MSKDLPFNLYLAKQGIGEATGVDVYGENQDVDIAAAEDIWDQGGDYVYTAAGGATHYISSSAADTQDVRIVLLSEDASGDWNLEDFEFTLVGTTKTAIVTPSGDDPVRILKAENKGSTVLTGDVYIYEDDTVVAGVPQTASKIRAKILIGAETTMMSVYTIPSGKSGYLRKADAMLTSALNCKCFLSIYAREDGETFRRVKRLNLALTNLLWQYDWATPLVFPAKTDIKFRCDSTDTNNSLMGAGFELLIM